MEYAATAPTVAHEEQRFLSRVFMWMFLGLTITGAIAALIGTDDTLLTKLTEHPGIVMVLIIAQLGLVLGLSFAINRISATVATAAFLLYSALTGVTFAFIFELYTAQSIFTTFLIAAAMFGGLAVWGAVTDVDLSKVGTIAIFALFGLIIATVVNIFVANSTLYWITTYAGVLIFSALTAYDMQKLKQIQDSGISGEQEKKLAIFGALSLYLDFINLFLFLLRIFGNQR
jgi:FtsH-binding integral membrane protein